MGQLETIQRDVAELRRTLGIKVNGIEMEISRREGDSFHGPEAVVTCAPNLEDEEDSAGADSE
jgi:hypothetical protein